MDKKILGILGGMGPAATVDLYGKIVAMTEASCDAEHIRTIIDSNTQIPDRTAAILSGGTNPVPAMESALENLKKCGAEVVIIPCNTAHYFLPALQQKAEQERAGIRFLSMIEATAGACADLNPKTAAILATKGTLESGIYQKSLDAHGVTYIVPDHEGRDVLMDVIYNGVKAGAEPGQYLPGFRKLLERMGTQGADYFILACTELPIAFRELSHAEISAAKFAAIDPTEVLAAAAIAACGYRVRD